MVVIPLVPKIPNGPLRVISVGRLSQAKATEAETQQSLDAIRHENERMLSLLYPGPKVVHYLGEQASGMLALRETMNELWELVATGDWDLIVAEDLSRIFRNPRFQWAFVQDAVDAQIRVICFADQLDTADDHWETMTACATLRHGLMIPDTRRRIRRTATESFHRGGQVGKVRASHLRVSAEDAKAGVYGPIGLRIRRNPDFIPILDEIRRRFEADYSPLAVVDWMNNSEVPVGPYVTSGRWTLKLLRGVLGDPLLHGTRRFRVTKHQPVFKTGKYRRDHNPEPETECVPELALVTREEQEALLALVGWTINWGGRPPCPTPHPRKGTSRYESSWPGQAATCGICGDKMFKCGKFLRCRNSFRRSGETCWNHAQVPVELLRAHVVGQLIRQYHESVAFRDVFVPAVRKQLRRQEETRASRQARWKADIAALEVQDRNLRKSIAVASEISDDALKLLVGDLAKVTAQLTTKRREFDGTPAAEENDVLSDTEIGNRLHGILLKLIESSFEMAEVIRQFVPVCEIVPIQALDSGLVRSRAKFVFSTLTNGTGGEAIESHEDSTLDLFGPPVHILLLPKVVALRSQSPRPTLKQIGTLLGTSYMTVKRALAYKDLMDREGLSEPYRVLTAKPDSASRWKHAS